MNPINPLWDTYQGRPPDTMALEVTQVIKDAILNHPRSLQKRIGPSEIGTPCDHCLAAKLAGWDRHEQGVPWATTKGTAVHEWLERVFVTRENERTDFNRNGNLRRWVCEQRVLVGRIGGTPITGSTDLLDTVAGATIDWKFVGTSSLRRYRAQGPSQTYRVQAHLYAKGWNDAGVRVDTVSICFLPAQSAQFGDHFWWAEPYQPEVAEQALARANHLWTQLDVLTHVSTQVRDQWITSLPRADGCWDCARYPDHPAAPQSEQGVLVDLTPTPTPQPAA